MGDKLKELRERSQKRRKLLAQQVIVYLVSVWSVWVCTEQDPALPPLFSAHVYCGQTARWIKMALGMEVGLGPGHIVLDGDTAPLPPKRGGASQFLAHVYCGQTAGWIKTPLVRKSTSAQATLY